MTVFDIVSFLLPVVLFHWWRVERARRIGTQEGLRFAVDWLREHSGVDTDIAADFLARRLPDARDQRELRRP